MEKECYYRDATPQCHLCHKKFKKDGERWRGNCKHFKGKVVEW